MDCGCALPPQSMTRPADHGSFNQSSSGVCIAKTGRELPSATRQHVVVGSRCTLHANRFLKALALARTPFGLLTFERKPFYSRAMSSNASFTGSVEFAPGFAPRPKVSHVLFDFDGTLSLIRQGWPEVMIPMFMEMLPRRADETDEAVRTLMTDDIMRLNGKQTIYQMIQLAERIKERGGQPREPLWYKHEYLHRLNALIRSRTDGLGAGTVKPVEWLVYGSRELLEN